MIFDPALLEGSPEVRYIPALAPAPVGSVCSGMRLLDKSGRERCGDREPGQLGSLSFV